MEQQNNLLQFLQELEKEANFNDLHFCQVLLFNIKLNYEVLNHEDEDVTNQLKNILKKFNLNLDNHTQQNLPPPLQEQQQCDCEPNHNDIDDNEKAPPNPHYKFKPDSRHRQEDDGPKEPTMNFEFNHNDCANYRPRNFNKEVRDPEGVKQETGSWIFFPKKIYKDYLRINNNNNRDRCNNRGGPRNRGRNN